MSQRAESLSGSRAMRKLEGGGSSMVRAQAAAYPVGTETGLPLIPCPECHLARVIELRVKQETVNKGRSFFKCPRNGTPKFYGFYKFQKDYFDLLVDKKIVRVMCEQLEELEEEGTEVAGVADCEAVQDEGRKDMEKKMEQLMWKLNFVIVCVVVAVFGIALRSVVMT